MTYLDDHPTWHDEDGPAKAREVDRLLAHVGWRPKRVLDVGCGTGAVLSHLDRLLQRRGVSAELEGWDVDPTPINRSPHPVSLRVGDALEQAEPADVVLLLDVLEHLATPKRALELLPRLAPRIVLRVPIEDSLRDRLRPAATSAARARYGHVQAWRRSALLHLLTERGLQIDATWTLLAPTPAPSPRTFFAEAWREALFRVAPAAVDLVGGGSVLIAGRW